MILQGQILDKDNLNRAFISKTATGNQPIAGSLTVLGILSGNGSGLTGLNATQLSTGTIADARLSSNVFLLNTSQIVTATNNFNVEQRFSRGTWVDPKSGLGAAIKYAQGLAGDTALFVGDVTIGNGTTVSKINFTAVGSTLGAPTGTSASNGSKIQLWEAGYGFGIENASVWYDAYTNHKFYTHSGTTTSTLRMTVASTGVTIANALQVSGNTGISGTLTLASTLTVAGAVTLNGNVTLGDAAADVISVPGTATFNEAVTMSKDLVVAGEFPNSVYNEFPDPLLLSGDTSLWTPLRGTLTFDPAQKPATTGAYGSLKLVPTAADSYAECSYTFDVNPNEWITYSMYAFSTVGSRTSQMFIYWLTASLTTISSSSNTINVATGWTRYSLTAQAPANARYFRIRFDNDGYNATTNATMYFSSFQIERGRATTGFKPYVGGNPSNSVTQGGVNIAGYYLMNDQGVLSLWNDTGLGGRITSKNNYGIRLEVGTGNIVIGGTNTGGYASKVAIGDAVTPSATLDVIGNQSAVTQTNFRVRHNATTGALSGMELKGLADTTGTGVWSALYAVKGGGTYAGLFNGAVEIDAGNLRIDTGELHMNATAGQTPLKLNAWNHGQGLWLISGNSAEAKFFIQTGAAGGPAYDYATEISYIPGTPGALAGVMRMGQMSRNNAAFTHGTTIFYTAGTESMRITKDSYVGINNPSPAQMLDVMGDVIIGANTANNVALEIRAPGIANATSAQDIKFAFSSAGSSSIRSYRGSSWGTYMQFLTTPDPSNTPTVRLHLDQNGYIGTSGVTNPIINLAIGDNDTGINWISDGNIQLWANSQNVIDLTSSAIGLKKNTTASGTLTVSDVTTLNNALVLNPNSGLSVIRTGTATGRITIYQNTTSTNSASWIEMWGTDGTARQGELTLSGTYQAFFTGSTSTVAGSESMRLTTTGLGIGTTSPAQKLEVVGTVRSTNFESTAVNGNGYQFWASTNYKIHMSSTVDGTWGGAVSGAATSDYNMYFRMLGGGTNRGFVFHTNTGKVAQIEGTGKIHTAVGVRIANTWETVANSTEDSLDFVYG